MHFTSKIIGMSMCSIFAFIVLLMCIRCAFFPYLSLICRDKSSQVAFLSIALFTIQIVSKQLYRDNRKIMQQSFVRQINNIFEHKTLCPQLSKRRKVRQLRKDN